MPAAARDRKWRRRGCDVVVVVVGRVSLDLMMFGLVVVGVMRVGEAMVEVENGEQREREREGVAVEESLVLVIIGRCGVLPRGLITLSSILVYG